MLETEIREMLRSKADVMTRQTTLPPPPLTRARAHRTVNIMTILAAVVVVAVGAVTVAGRLGGARVIEPIRPDPRTSSLRIAEQSTDIAVGFGSVWLTTEFSVVRFDPASSKVIDTYSCPGGLRPLRPIQAVPGATKLLAVGNEAVWAIGHRPADACDTTPRPTSSTSQGSGSVSSSIGTSFEPHDLEGGWGLIRVDVERQSVRILSIGAAGSAQAIAASDGFLWIAEGQGNAGRIIKVAERSGEVVGETAFHGVPVSIAAEGQSIYASIHNAPGVPDEVVKIDGATSKVTARASHDIAGNIVARDGVVMLASPADSGLAVTGIDPVTLRTKAPYYLLERPFLESDMDLMQGRVVIADFVFEVEPRDTIYVGPAASTGRLEAITLVDPVRYLAASEGVIWVAGNVNGYTVLTKIKL